MCMRTMLSICRNSCQAQRDFPCVQYLCLCWLPFQLTTATVGTCLCLSISRFSMTSHKDYLCLWTGSLQGAHPGLRQTESQTLRSTSQDLRNFLLCPGLQADVEPVWTQQVLKYKLQWLFFVLLDWKIHKTALCSRRVLLHQSIKILALKNMS